MTGDADRRANVPMCRVLLGIKSALIRQAFTLALAAQQAIIPVGGVGRPDDLDRVLRHLRPEVLVLESAMAGHRLERLAGVPSWAPGCQLVLLTDRPSAALTRKAGLQGIQTVTYDSSLECLAGSVRAAARRLVDSPNLDGKGVPPEVTAEPLRQREIDVLRLTAAGHEPSEIARSLRLSTGTVRNYLTFAVAKLGPRSA